MPDPLSDSRSSWTFGAVGDLALCGPTAVEMQRHGTSWPFELVRPILGKADVLFGNLECVILPPDYPAAEIDDRGLTAGADAATAAADAGFDFLNLANNHMLDGGTTALLHTVDAVTNAGILGGGVGATQDEARRLRVLEKAGLRWGFLCYGEDSNYSLSTQGPSYAYYEPAAVLEDIALARLEVDVLVVSVHADLEFTETPSVPRRDAFRRFAQAGATLVLGHHPHVPQGIERIGGSLIAYSLGNFVFHTHTSSYLSRHLPHTAQTFVLLAEVTREGVQRVDRIPVLIGAPPDQRPRPSEGAEADAISARLGELDRFVADDARVVANWRDTAVRQLIANVGRMSSLAAEDDILHTLGRLTLVAENRAWVDEAGKAVAERWELQRRLVDPYHKPSFGTENIWGADRRSLLTRAANRVRRQLRCRDRTRA